MRAGFLRLDGVAKRYGPVVAVAGVSVQVGQGEFLGLLGPSGCGKTTTLQMIAGFEAPTEGRIVLDGQDLSAVPPARRGIGLVFQSYALFPHMTAAENVAFGLEMRRVPRPERERRVAEALDMVHLSHLAGRFPREMSGGQQQRVALARALAPQPDVVLFDEAFGNLDSALRTAVRQATVSALRATGAAGVFVTHDQAEALAVGDRVAVMRSGRFEHISEPAEAFHAPATRFVATLLGEADFLPGRQSGESVTTELGTLTATPQADGAVEVMLRPHEVTFIAQPGAPARVESREFRGASYLYALRLPSGALIRSVQPHTADVRVGTPVAVHVEAGHPVRSFAPGA